MIRSLGLLLAPGATGSVSAQPSDVQGPSEALPRQSAVVLSNGVRHAVFTSKDGLSSVTVGKGERIGPFAVTAITVGRVQLVGPQGAHTISPTPHADVRASLASQVADRLSNMARRQAEADNDK